MNDKQHTMIQQMWKKNSNRLHGYQLRTCFCFFTFDLLILAEENIGSSTLHSFI